MRTVSAAKLLMPVAVALAAILLRTAEARVRLAMVAHPEQIQARWVAVAAVPVAMAGMPLPRADLEEAALA